MDEDIEEIRERKLESLQERAESGSGSATGPEHSESSPAEPVHVDGQSHLQEVVDANELVLVDFYADWCGPCQMLEPVVETIAAETDAAVAKVDVDANQALAGQFQVRGVPTIALFDDGEVVERFSGVRGEDELRALVAQYS
jgi:thioredoxin 1